MSMATSGQIPTWTVISQQVATGRTPGGTASSGHLITAQLPSGTAFQVFVPDAQYNIDTIREMLAAKAAKVAAVDSLSSGS